MIRAAVYGLGRWGETLIRAVNGKSESIEVVTGITRSPKDRAALADKYGLALTDSYAKVLADPSIDAVILATPHSQHVSQICLAASSGKHVFVEKPITLTQADAVTAVTACQQAGVALGIGFGRRFRPAYLEMLRMVRAGEIGDVLHVEAQHSGPSGYRVAPGSWRADRRESPAGGMTARGIHALDAMVGVSGNVEQVYAFSDRRVLTSGIDDTTSMLLKFQNGVTGYLSTIFVTADTWFVHVYGSRGWVKMNGEHQLIISNLAGEVDVRDFKQTDIEKEALEAFAECVSSGEPFPVTPGQAVNSIAVLEAITSSQATGFPITVDF